MTIAQSRAIRGSITLKVAAVLAVTLAPAAWISASHASTHKSALDDWTLVFPKPAIGKYEDFAFPDSLHGWLVSASGTIYHTGDGGVNWEIQSTGKPGLRSIDFIDAKRGFAGTLTGKLFGTTDGGITWNDISAMLPKAVKGFCGMTHVGEHVHIVGRYNGLATDYFFSPDGGKTWRYEDLGDLAQGLVDVSFLNDSVGFIGGMGKSAMENQGSPIILKTTDRGLHWRVVFHHDGGRGYAWKLFPIDKKVIYTSLQSQDGVYRIVKTVDAGETWDTLIVATDRPAGIGMQGIGFIDANTGWVGGFFQGLWGTTDGGKTWTQTAVTDGLINRFEHVGTSLVTAGTRGILRYDQHRH